MTWKLLLVMALAGVGTGAVADAPQRVPLAVVVNGQPKPDIIAWLSPDGLWLLEADALGWGLKAKSDITLDGRKASSLKSLGGKVTFDEGEMRLTVVVEAADLPGSTTLNLRAAPAAGDGVVLANGLILDYDLGAGRIGNVTSLDGLLRTHASLAGWQLLDERAATVLNGHYVSHATRTTVRKDWLQKGWRLDLGSLTTPDAGLATWNYWRGAGLSSAYYGYNSQQAALASAGFSTLVKYPSTADVYVNGAKQGTYAVNPGSFDVQGLRGYAPGATDVRAVIRDVFGNEQVVNETSYVADGVLAPGVHEFNYQIGRDEFRRSRGLELRGVHRAGVSRDWTVTGRLESRSGFTAAQVGAVTQAASLGELGGSVMVGKARGAASPWGFALHHQYQARAGSVLTVLTSRLAPVFDGIRLDQLRIRQLSTRGTYAAGAMGQVVAGASLSALANGRTLRETEIGWSKHLPREKIYLQVFVRSSSVAGRSVQVMLTWRPDASGSVTSFTELHRGRVNQQLAYGEEAGEGRTAWRVQGQVQEGVTGATGYFERLTSAGALRANVSADKYGSNARIGWRGAVAVGGAGVSANSRHGDAAVVVDADGLAGVGVFRNGTPIGSTDSTGKLWVSGLTGYEEVRITLDENDIPIDRWYSGSGTKAMRPSPGSVVPLLFDVRRFRTVDLSVERCGEAWCQPMGDETVVLESEGGALVSARLQGGRAQVEGVLTGLHTLRTADDTCTGQLDVKNTGPAWAKLTCSTRPGGVR